MPHRTWPTGRRIAYAVRRAVACHGRDRGANPVELAILMPAILVLLFGSIQTAAWFLARTTAMHAAQQAVNAQRAYQAPAGVGETQAESFLDQAGDWLVDWDVAVTVSPDTAEVSATVEGEALTIIPFLPMPDISQTAHGTVERFTPP
ncbi:pilus assembly protein [Solwaraspora sp. WMMD1047]|uniref:TadE/TadG family type IV pilus assembly protein n=1 Tax=Solwaraspora sp. WMMD1047 TaxID=3016102 RepID=UPI002416955F|nr:TadE family protein [Solwaraspora sp. WMMD1047]MDG4827835.1 pilus assembly protein [Solwaraspora sp. WMMD1047]